MKVTTNTQKLTISAITIALYIVLMICTQHFAFGQYQVRIATALYGLSAIFPFLIIPLGLANVVTNMLLGGLGILDIVGGGLVGVITTSIIVLGKRYNIGNWLIMVAITFVPGLLVPIWLSIILGIPYLILASSILV